MNDKSTHNPEYIQAQSVARDALKNFLAEGRRLLEAWQEMEYQSKEQELLDDYPFSHSFEDILYLITDWVDSNS